MISTSVEGSTDRAVEQRSVKLEQAPRKKASAPKSSPLSFAQQRLWFIELMEPGSPIYNLSRVIRLRGRLDLQLLRKAVKAIVARHESLRTTIAVVDGNPVQLIAEQGVVSMPVIDLSESPDTHREDEVTRLVTEEVRRPFAIAQGPLLRTTVLRLGEVEHVFVLTIHHIVSDGWSMGILLRELAAFYNAFAIEGPSPLPELPIQYADFSRWQKQWLSSEVLEKQIPYWRHQLGGSLPVLELPMFRPRPAVQTFRGAKRSLVFTKSLTEALKRLSQREGITLFMTLLAAFKTLLYRYTGQNDIIVGVPIACRNRRETEGLIGLFVNTLVLCTDVSGNPRFRELLRRVREVALGAYAHQDLPFEKLVEELQPNRDLSHSPLFQVMFVFQNIPRQSMELPGLTLSLLEVDSGTSMYDLTLFLWAEADGLVGRLEYNTDLFEEATIDRMIGHFQTLLEGIAVDAEQRLSALPLLTESERQQLVVWNDTKRDYPQDSCLNRLFEQQVRRTPDNVAVISDTERLTYCELNQRANRLARHLQKRGVGPDVLVGLCMQRSPDMLVGLLAVLKAGGAYVPLDPTYPLERIRFMLEDTAAPVVITHERVMSRIPNIGQQIVCMDSQAIKTACEHDEDLEVEIRPENLAYVIYTSGSTGRPKGVLVEHRSVANLFTDLRDRLGIKPGHNVFQFTTVNFDVFIAELCSTLLNGATWVLTGSAQALFGSDLVDLLRNFAVNAIFAPPSALTSLVGTDLPDLSLIVSAGEACPPSLARQLAQGRRFINAYGPTEATVYATAAEYSAHRKDIPIGRPLANVQVYILDAQMQPTPISVPGELYIGGVGVARGYRNRPELTAEKFIEDPFSEEQGARLYKTGDLAHYLPDGNIEYLGRLDHQVKVRGFRIELGEVEAVLCQHLGIEEAVVIAWEKTLSDKRLVAYLVATREPAPSIQELRDFLKGKLPEYMVPSGFIFLDALPLSPSGKLDRRALPAPNQVGSEQEKNFVAPRDMLELQLTKIWEQILGRSPIGRRDNFFELGGHSLLAVQLLRQVQEVVGKALPVIAMFQAPTIEQLATILRQEGWSSPWSSLVPIQPNGFKPPFFFVTGGQYHFGDRLGPDQPVYRLQMQNFDQPFTFAEDMAAYCLKDVRSLQSEGPYFLGGHCFGGVIAFEMAQQLRKQGQQVALLALFDSYVSGSIRVLAGTSFASRLWRRIVFHGNKILQVGASEEFAHVMRGVRRKTREMVWRQVWKFSPQAGEPLIKSLKDPRAANYKARKSYVPQVYPGRITLFRCTERGAWKHYDPKNGWGNLAMGEVEIHQIPGNHTGMYQEPNVRLVVENLRACLERAQSGTDLAV